MPSVAYHNLSDSQLAQLLRQGERYAFDEIYHRYWKLLYRKAYYLLSEQEVCEDLIQDIFAYLWLKREKHQIENLSAYLNAILKFKIASIFRKVKVVSKYLQQLPEQDKSPDPVLEIELRNLQTIISDFTSNLPERCQMIFKLSRFEGLSNKAIAEKMQVSEKTVENQISIALKKLRLSLDRLNTLFPFF